MAAVYRWTRSLVTIFLILCGIRKNQSAAKALTPPVRLSIGTAKWVCVRGICGCMCNNTVRQLDLCRCVCICMCMASGHFIIEIITSSPGQFSSLDPKNLHINATRELTRTQSSRIFSTKIIPLTVYHLDIWNVGSETGQSHTSAFVTQNMKYTLPKVCQANLSLPTSTNPPSNPSEALPPAPLLSVHYRLHLIQPHIQFVSLLTVA